MARTILASNFRLINQSGAVAQLGERLNGIQEVRGSIPLGSTNQSKDFQHWENAFRGRIPFKERGPYFVYSISSSFAFDYPRFPLALIYVLPRRAH